jgi:hypothetical protein
LPLAFERPTDIVTATAPLPLMPPVTLPPPADETRCPKTVKGTLWFELQLPAWVARPHSKRHHSSALWPLRRHRRRWSSRQLWQRTPAANIQRNTPLAVRSAKKMIGRADDIFFSCFDLHR